MNEYREEDPATVAPSNGRELFDTLAAARNSRIVAEAQELDTIHRLCLAYRDPLRHASEQKPELITPNWKAAPACER